MWCLIICLLLGAQLDAQSKELAQPGSTVVLTVGNEQITKADFELLVRLIPGATSQVATAEGLRRIVDRIVQIKALAQEARRSGRDRTPVTRQELTFRTDQVLADVEMAHRIEASSINEDMIRKHYEQHKSDFELVEARHILIRFKDSVIPASPGQPELTAAAALEKALAIRRQLASGDDFARMAFEHSDDSSTKASGGELGILNRGQAISPLYRAAFDLPSGGISNPVRTNYGYHIIETKRHSYRRLDEVRDDIESELRRDRAKLLANDAVKRTNVVLDPTYFKGMPAEAPLACPAPRN